MQAKQCHVLLLGPTDDYIKKVQSCNVTVTILTELTRLTPWQQTQRNTVLLADLHDIPAILLMISDFHAKKPFDLVISFTEYGMEPAAIIGAILQIPGPSLRCSLICRDKLRTRQALIDTPQGNVPFSAVENHIKINEFINKYGLPIVVKPRFSTGSQQVNIINHTSDLLPDIDSTWLVEGFAPGKEYSCETFSIGGKHHLLAITEKQLGGNANVVEVGHKILPENIIDIALRQWIFKILDTIEMIDGIGHIEFKKENENFYLIECHNRPGGDRIWQLVELATGIDMITSYIDLLIGRTVNFLNKISRCAAIIYFQFPPGTVNNYWHLFNSPPQWIHWHQWIIKEKDEILPIIDSFHRYGGFIVDAESKEELEQRIAYVLNHTGVS
ncbi:ATP-grasp domain-containing protein [Xenorhabdus bovienii]|uniref:ATP-grasp domain-containing protein n=1 Tax=Xenorhabdus bovienii str. feltiae Moldova TaxID=1398200 RepID=A0A077NVC8_XENBV|nr:ATP-grasp domain-containing protein [Xenorhabdus bovienii]CDH01566.1 conserved hypothetical protein [Xenorhabdus bovienii str. feltiae Moldova]